ncbi:hypothetical protein [Staphylococcus saprophyticus]|nr:hypothetical protein [Staphylococcus saprophyticus]
MKDIAQSLKGIHRELQKINDAKPKETKVEKKQTKTFDPKNFI